jgi:hypothetical protein
LDREFENVENLFFETYQLDTTEITKNYRTDLRTDPPDGFQIVENTNWRALKWPQIGRPYGIHNYSGLKREWEIKNGMDMPEIVQWRFHNRNMHELFHSDLSQVRKVTRKQFHKKLIRFKFKEADDSLQKMIRLKLWYNIHHKEDAIWDPRGKRASFEGLGVNRPRILALGAGDGFDAMILSALYPGSEAVLVDFDDFCLTDRFGRFPEEYPFLARNPKTGYWNVFNKSDFKIRYEVKDIHDLAYGKEFDIVLSSGLIEHYPDKYKPLAFHLHHQFLKPNGFAIITSTRNNLKMRTFYHLIGELLNYSYRELMDENQLALYTFENGFKIIKACCTKAHNCVVTQKR